MMPSLNKCLSSTTTTTATTIATAAAVTTTTKTTTTMIGNRSSDFHKLSSKIELTNHDKNKFQSGADQVRILLFRECEWRGRKLLFDSVTAGRNNNRSTVNDIGGKHTMDDNSCPRNGNGLPQENEKKPYDNVSLLSEMIFGTVAMTYRGPLFKVHTFDSPRCIMCTKVFPASDHNPRRQRLSDNTMDASVNLDCNSSNDSIRNTLSATSFGNSAGNSPRKSSACSSTCGSWDIDIPLLGSTQSLGSNSSSGFGSFSNLRRRWLRAMSTSLSHSECDEIFGFKPYVGSLSDMCDMNARRHRTRLGLAVLIKLKPGQERQMEMRLLEHAAQLEAMMNRLCYACIEPTGSKMSGEYHGLIQRMRRTSSKCTLRLFRLLFTTEITRVPSIWHEILLNTSACMETRLKTLYRSFQQMCQLLDTIDTKSTNFFLSTVVTAVLTYHLGWVNTVMSPRDQIWVENMKKKCPCNPLWAQLSDLYGTLGNPVKFVHTVISGDEDKIHLINAILTFLSYFIRSAIVERRNEIRDAPENDLQEAISIIQHKKGRNDSFITNSPDKLRSALIVGANDGESISATRSNTILRNNSSLSSVKQMELECRRENSSDGNDNKSPVHSNIPKLRKANSLHMNLENYNSNTLSSKTKLSLKLESNHDNTTYHSESGNYFDKDTSSNALKKIVSQMTTEALDSEKLFPVTSVLDEIGHKHGLRTQELSSISPKLSFLHHPPENNFDVNKLHINSVDDTAVFFSHVAYTDIKQNPVLFTLGDEDKSLGEIASSSPTQSILGNTNCHCSFAFTRVPSTSAQLPEGVLRKIIQRNFPESSKSIQRPPDTSSGKERSIGFCPKCNGSGNNYEADDKLLLETPTNATEVLRTCGSSVSTRGARPRRVDTLEELLKANDVVELPMPTSKNISEVSKEFRDIPGFTDTLIQRTTTTQVLNSDNDPYNSSGFVSGLVIQGLIRKRGRRKNVGSNSDDDGSIQQQSVNSKENLIAELREEVTINARFPIVDQPVSEALCILADVDDWQVGVISNNMLGQSPLLPVGMSRLVSDMLEAFVYLWTTYHSPTHCLNILECKLREMWLRSEALAEMLLTSDVCNISLTSLTNALDLDAADIPLLLAVATVHSPQIAQRFGLTLT